MSSNDDTKDEVEDTELEDSEDSLPTTESPRIVLRRISTFPSGMGPTLRPTVGVEEAMTSIKVVLRIHESEEEKNPEMMEEAPKEALGNDLPKGSI